jgi:thiosulfate/3-mercaptopyruvate sulfurtransferase
VTVQSVELEELESRLGEPGLLLLDVRSAVEFAGEAGYGCDPRQGHIPGARHLDVHELARCESLEAVRELIAAPQGTEIVAYCHSGGRSAYAAEMLVAAGYAARNYAGSWHEWSGVETLPVET